MGAKLLNTKGRHIWNGITVVAAGEVIGRITTLTLADRVAKVVGMPIREGFSMGCAVLQSKCGICDEEWDDEDPEYGR